MSSERKGDAVPYAQWTLAQKATVLVSSGLYTGYIPIASGTWATALAILLYWPFAQFNRPPGEGNGIFIYIAVVIALSIISIWTSDVAEKLHAEKDPHKVVIDEIAGFFVSMFLLPWEPMWVAAAFFGFRVFDVWKPYPIRQLQSLKGGLGITIDDLLAGVWTCALLHLARAFLPI